MGNLNGYYEFKLPDSGIGTLNKRSINHLTIVDKNEHLTQALQNEPNVSEFRRILIWNGAWV